MTFTVLRNSCTLYTFTVLRQKALTFTLPPPYDRRVRPASGPSDFPQVNNPQGGLI